MYNTMYNTEYNTEYNNKYNNKYDNKYKNNITCIQHVCEIFMAHVVNTVLPGHLKVGSVSEAIG
jgi:hypothetical protein